MPDDGNYERHGPDGLDETGGRDDMSGSEDMDEADMPAESHAH